MSFVESSYPPDDVTFLLRETSLAPVPLEEREYRIQAGISHYSEMIGPEDAPSRLQMQLFRQCMEANGRRLANDISALAAAMADGARENELTIVSIARAGTPIGVLLKHRIQEIAPQIAVKHYSTSVIRDRGIDLVALKWVLKRHSAASVRFVDGWTGKGTIANELRRGIQSWSRCPSDLSPELWVPLDICGATTRAARTEDYLIPSALLGGTVSGLVSRSILSKGEQHLMHSCVPLDHIRKFDLSGWFVRSIRSTAAIQPAVPPAELAGDALAREACAIGCLNTIMARHKIDDKNKVKLGIGETVRVLLRRKPEVVYVGGSMPAGEERWIAALAASRAVPIRFLSEMPMAAVAVIGRPHVIST